MIAFSICSLWTAEPAGITLHDGWKQKTTTGGRMIMIPLVIMIISIVSADCNQNKDKTLRNVRTTIRIIRVIRTKSMVTSNSGNNKTKPGIWGASVSVHRKLMPLPSNPWRSKSHLVVWSSASCDTPCNGSQLWKPLSWASRARMVPWISSTY